MIISMIAVNADIEATSIKVDGDERLDQTGNAVVERGEEFDVKVRVFSNTSQRNVVVSAEILGYEYSKYEDSLEDDVSPFDLEANDSKAVTLNLAIPDNAEKDYYDLRVRVASRTGASQEYLIHLRLDGQRHDVIIRDIQIADTVIAGRSIIGNVRVKNIGQKTEEGVKVTLSIPELGISDSEYIDDLDEDDSTTSEDLLLRIPKCAEEGYYEVVAEIEFNDNYDTLEEYTEIRVLASDACETSTSTSSSNSDASTKTVVTVPSSQEIKAGQSAVYPIVISNLGSSAKTYVLTVSPSVEGFATYRIDPSNVMVINGEGTETAYLYVTVDENAQSGLRDFKVTVKADGESKDVTLTASITSDASSSTVSSDSLKTALQISLLVLVVLLLILLIIFGFNKMKGEKDEEEEVGQTYY